jgi:hypothetical protein
MNKLIKKTVDLQTGKKPMWIVSNYTFCKCFNQHNHRYALLSWTLYECSFHSKFTWHSHARPAFTVSYSVYHSLEKKHCVPHKFVSRKGSTGPTFDYATFLSSSLLLFLFICFEQFTIHHKQRAFIQTITFRIFKLNKIKNHLFANYG